MSKTISLKEALTKTQFHKKFCPIPKILKSKLPGCTGLAVSAYYKKAEHKKRCVVGFIFLYPIIEKNDYMLPGDEIFAKPILALQITSPTLQIFTQLIKNIQRNHFEKLRDVLTNIQYQQSKMIVANINL